MLPYDGSGEIGTGGEGDRTKYGVTPRGKRRSQHVKSVGRAGGAEALRIELGIREGQGESSRKGKQTNDWNLKYQ